MSGMKMTPPKEAVSISFVFNDNGTFLPADQYPENTPIPDGRWTLVPDEKLVRLHMDDRLIGKITTITADKMIHIFEPDEDTGMPVAIEGHFKPISK